MKISVFLFRGGVNFEIRRFLELTLIAFAILIICNSLNWINVRVWGLGASEFLDLEATVNFVNCFEVSGASIYSISSDLNCSNYVYGISLVFLADIFGINHIPIHLLGIVFLGMLAFVLAYFVSAIKVRFFSATSIMIILVLSPPISLLAQRGNIDILIAFLVLIGIESIRYGMRVIGFVLIALTVLIKFYTLPLMLLILLQKQFRKPFYFASALILNAATMVNFSMIRALPSDGTYAAFGNRAIYYYLQDLRLFHPQTPRFLGDLTGLILVTLVIIFMTLLNRIYKTAFDCFVLKKNLEVPNAFLLIGISCYMFGMSYDYRLIFLMLPMILIQGRGLVGDRLVQTLLILTVAFTSFNSTLLVQFVGDIVIGVVISLLIFLFLRSIRARTDSRPKSST